MFKENVKKLLNERGMKLGTLASSIGISYSTMDSIINGNVDEMRIGVDKVLAIAEFFGVTVEELYGRPVVQKIEEVPARIWRPLLHQRTRTRTRRSMSWSQCSC